MSLHEDTAPIPGRRHGNLTNCGGGSIDVARYMSEEIHKTESRSVVITNTFADYGHVEWNSNLKFDSYVLLTPSRFSQESDIVQSVESQLKQHSSHPGWNPRARFVVTVTNISFKHNAEKLSQKILAELWKRKVINGIVLVPLIYSSNTEDDNDSRNRTDSAVSEVPSLGIYTWFPYRSPKECSVVNETLLLDVWLMSGEGSFFSNSVLFPKKLSGNFHGCEFRVANALRARTREVGTRKSGNRIISTDYDGLEIQLIKFIRRVMNVTIIRLPQVKNFRIIQDESGNYVGYTALFMNDEADIAFGGIMRTTISTSLMDVTKSYFQSSWQWYVPCPVKFPRWRSIFRIFSPSVWFSIFLASMFANIVIVFLARFGVNEHESFRCVSDTIIVVWALLLGVSISPLPRTVPLRVFVSAWVCYSLAINAVFQADLTTFLEDPGLEKSITSVEEIFTSGIKYGFNSHYFDSNFNDKTNPNHMKILKNRIDCANVVTCVLWTAKYKNISSLCPSKYIEYLYYNSEYSDELKDHQYCGLKETPVLVTDVLMTLQKGSPFLDRVNKIIGRLTEGGIIAYLQKFVPETKSFIKTKPNTSKSFLNEYCALSMNNLQPVFFLFLFGHGLGLITFLMEIVYSKIHLLQH
jgi:hypothetical protein